MKLINYEQIIQIARAYYKSNQYQQVKSILQQFIQQGVQRDEIYFLIGNAHYCLDEYKQAIKAYHHAIQINPNVAIFYANLGKTYVQLQVYDEAINLYHKAIAIEPNYLEVYHNLIYVYSITQKTSDAIKVCGQILDKGCDSNSLGVASRSSYNRQNPSSAYLSYIDMYSELHVDGDLGNKISSEKMYSGASIIPWVTTVKSLIILTDSRTLLDYGSGKGLQYKKMLLEDENQIKYNSLQDYWGVDEIYCYDPAYILHQKLPQKQYDSVVVTDVLEHCHQEDVKWIIDEIFGLTTKFVFANIACYLAHKSFQNGENVHSTIRPAVWWDVILQSVASRYPEIKYCFLVEYIWNDIGSEGGRVFQVLSNLNSFEMEIDPTRVSVLETNSNLGIDVPYKIVIDPRNVLCSKSFFIILG